MVVILNSANYNVHSHGWKKVERRDEVVKATLDLTGKVLILIKEE